MGYLQVYAQRETMDQLPTKPINPLDPPIEIEDPIKKPLGKYILPIIMALTAVGGMGLMMLTRGRMMSVGIGMMGVSLIAAAASSASELFGGEGQRKLNYMRLRYARYINKVKRPQLHEVQDLMFRGYQQRSGRNSQELINDVHAGNFWNRSTDVKENFGVLRLGLGTQKLCVSFDPPEIDDTDMVDPWSMERCQNFYEAQQVVNRIPTWINITKVAKFRVNSVNREKMIGLARSVIVQLSRAYPPDKLKLVLLCDPLLTQDWEWLKYLPHVEHDTRKRPNGSPELMLYTNTDDLEFVLGPEFAGRSPFSAGEKESHLTQYFIIYDGFFSTSKAGGWSRVCELELVVTEKKTTEKSVGYAVVE